MPRLFADSVLRLFHTHTTVCKHAGYKGVATDSFPKPELHKSSKLHDSDRDIAVLMLIF